MKLWSNTKENYKAVTKWYELMALAALVLIFIVICFGYSANFKLGQFPDEYAHIGYIFDVINHGFPNYIDGKIYDSDKLNYLPHPPLFYIIAGNTFKFFNFFYYIDIKYIRLINILLSSLTITVIFYSLRILKIRLLPSVIATAILICIPFFCKLSGSINNDPLSILGCSLITLSLVLITIHKNNFLTLFVLFLGLFIVALTKFNAGITVICIIFIFIVFNKKNALDFVKKVKNENLIVAIFFSSIVIIYYIYALINFGSLWTAPQGNPSDWYLMSNSDAPRMGIIDYWFKFYDLNFYSLVNGSISSSDLPGRWLALDIILFCLPLIIVHMLFGGSKKLLRWAGLFQTFTISFLLFIAIYFFIVRNEYLRTGYPGMIQARYFFGFLPGMVILYGLGLNEIKKSYVLTIFSLIVLLCVAMSVYPPYNNLQSKNLISSQEVGDLVIGELTRDKVFEQTFIARYKNIEKIELFLATYARKNNGKIKFELVDKSGKVLGSKFIGANKLIDNAWVAFNFGELNLTVADIYRLRLSSDDSDAGNAITWWATRPKIPPKDIFSGTAFGPREERLREPYPDGNALLDGKSLDADFKFRIYYGD